MLKKYQSKPIERLAYQIKEEDILVDLGNSTWDCTSFEFDLESIRFKAYEPPAVGDWIVYLNDDDVYHCSDKVFRERNIVGDES